MPGVGPITALTWALEIGDYTRFHSIKEAIRYCGLCGDEKSSADMGETHDHASSFARNIASYSEVDIDPAMVETNLVRFGLRGLKAAQFVDEAHRLGVHMLPSGPNAVRAVFYLDISDSDVGRASDLIGQVLRNLESKREEHRPAGSVVQY